MTEPIASAQSPKPRRRWLKICLWLAAGFVVSLVLAFFVVTSSGFFKSVILPRVSRSLNAQITVGDASIHPFSQVVLTDFKIQPDGQQTLATAAQIRLNYHLWDILHGNIRVDDAEVVSPDIELVENPDGTHNWDPLTKKAPSKTASPQPSAPSTKASKPLQVDLGKLTLNNATIHRVKNYDSTHADSTILTNLNFTLSGLKNGQTAKLDLSAVLQAAQNPPTGAAGALTAPIRGNLNCSFSADLKPESINGDATFSVSQATGTLENFAAFGTALKCDVTPSEIKELALSFQKAGDQLGALAVSGPFDPQKMEGKLDVSLHGIDRRLLNLAAAKNGIDFGTTTIDGTTAIQLTKGGNSIAATGKLTAAKVQLTRAAQTTPMLDLSANYDLAVDRAAQTIILDTLNLAGTQNGAPLLGAQLSSPMNVSWGSQAGNSGDAAFNLNVTGLNLADWKPFLGNTAPTGNVGAKLKISSHQGGQEIVFDLTSELNNLAFQAGNQQVSGAGITFSAQGNVARFKQVTLSSCDLRTTLQNQPALTASGTGTYDAGTGDADLQVKLQAVLARLLSTFPQPNLACSSGDLNLNAHVVQKQKKQSVTGDMTLNQFNGQAGKSVFQNYGGKFNLDLASSPEEIQINHFAGSFNQNGNAGGEFDLSGTSQSANKSVDVILTLSGLNENTLRPILEPMLSGKTLASVALSGKVSAHYQPQSDSAVKADVNLSNLVVTDPQHKLPSTPLAAGLQIDASLGKQTADVRQFQIALTPTARAANQLQFTGHVDFSDTNAIQGNLKLASDSLDLTLYYDLFASTNTVAGKAPATTSPAPSTSSTAAAETEPPAVKLPLRNFTVAANVGQLYLHEVAITNFQTTVKIDNSHVVVNPLQLALNGGPVNGTADLDLGVPGYNYNVTFSAMNVPLAPAMDTFQPARTGQIGGFLNASAQIKGAGITGAGLQRNLTGTTGMTVTNLNFSLQNLSGTNGVENILRTIVTVVASLPEIKKDPSKIIGAVQNGFSAKGSLTGPLEQAPIQTVSVQGTVNSGKINLQQSLVQSSAFKASATGTIALAPVLNNSTLDLPVNIWLSHAIADRASLTSIATTDDGTYAQMPQLLTVTGTLAKPDKKINALPVAGVAARAILNSGLINTNNSTGALINSVGGALLNSTNSPVKGLLNQLLK